MATIRLIPSTYYVSSDYLSVSDENNMYHNIDSSTYGTVTNSQRGTTSYYIYLRGFNFDDIPSDAEITSWTVKLKARESGITTSTSYTPKLCHGTSQITSTCDVIDDTTETHEFTNIGEDFEDIKSYGDNFGIRINCRRSNRNTTGYMYIYGAEIEVVYTIPNPRTITTSLNGKGTIEPNGDTISYDGMEFELKIIPENIEDNVSATMNGVDITSQLITHYVPGATSSNNRVLGSYNLVSGGFNGSGATYFSGLTGKGHTSSTTTSNYYSSGSGTIAVFTYDISFDLPAGAEITNLYVMINGHAESTSNSSEYMCAQIISGSEELSDELNFKSIGTSNSTQTITATQMPTVEQVANLKLQCRLGYYGGAINGATCYIEYTIPTTEIDYYSYSYEVNGDAIIIVTIKGLNTIYFKRNNQWVGALKAFKKVNGTWVEQEDLTQVFQNNINYVWEEL